MRRHSAGVPVLAVAQRAPGPRFDEQLLAEPRHAARGLAIVERDEVSQRFDRCMTIPCRGEYRANPQATRVGVTR